METSDLASVAQARAQQLPGVTQEFPFGPQTETYKVAGKMFLLIGERAGEPVVTVKAQPADATVLRTAFPDIEAGYHMNKKHWISFSPSSALERELVADLVTESYLLVVAMLPRRLQPVNPQTFCV